MLYSLSSIHLQVLQAHTSATLASAQEGKCTLKTLFLMEQSHHILLIHCEGTHYGDCGTESSLSFPLYPTLTTNTKMQIELHIESQRMWTVQISLVPLLCPQVNKYTSNCKKDPCFDCLGPRPEHHILNNLYSYCKK